jgi:hypothetical protein
LINSYLFTLTPALSRQGLIFTHNLG